MVVLAFWERMGMWLPGPGGLLVGLRERVLHGVTPSWDTCPWHTWLLHRIEHVLE